MNAEELKARTRQFALRVISLADALPRTAAGRVLGTQLIRAATSVAANYRAACRARSSAEFIAKIGTVEEESDECCFWIELIAGSGLMAAEDLDLLGREASELTAIMVASRKTAKLRSSRIETRGSGVARASNRQSTIGNRQFP